MQSKRQFFLMRKVFTTWSQIFFFCLTFGIYLWILSKKKVFFRQLAVRGLLQGLAFFPSHPSPVSFSQRSACFHITWCVCTGVLYPPVFVACFHHGYIHRWLRSRIRNWLRSFMYTFQDTKQQKRDGEAISRSTLLPSSLSFLLLNSTMEFIMCFR